MNVRKAKGQSSILQLHCVRKFKFFSSVSLTIFTKKHACFVCITTLVLTCNINSSSNRHTVDPLISCLSLSDPHDYPNSKSDSIIVFMANYKTLKSVAFTLHTEVIGGVFFVEYS